MSGGESSTGSFDQGRTGRVFADCRRQGRGALVGFLHVGYPDVAASLAAMRHLAGATGRRAGGSTGTNLWGAFALVAEMLRAGAQGSVVTLLCDGGERYAHTYYSDDWVAAQGLDLAAPAETLRRFAETGEWAAG